MNANFDEKQAFKDLHDILNHLNNFANYYYDEMQKAKDLCVTKANTIKELQKQLADERDKAETRLKETIQAKDAELAAQLDTFTKALEKSREDNKTFNLRLQKDESDLQEKKEALDKKEKKLKERDEQLQNASDTLVAKFADLAEKRRDFYALKEIRETTPSDAERIKNLEEEVQGLTLKNKELTDTLKDTNKKLDDVQKDKEKWKNIAENADAERKSMDSDAKNTADFVHADNFDDDLDVAHIKNNFDDRPAENDADNYVDNTDENLNGNLNDRPAENADTVTDSKKPNVPWLE